MKEFRIQKVNTRPLYESLRDLWVRVFGDEPEFVDAFFENFGADLTFMAQSDSRITGYAVCTEEGNVVSALTLYKCGSMYVPEGYDEWQDEDNEDPETPQAWLEDIADRPVYVSYAVCTDPEYRGMGLGAELTEYVRRIVTGEPGRILFAGREDAPETHGLGGISLVSPAEPSLIDFYSRLGYREGFTVSEGIGFPEMLLYDPESDYDDEDDSLLWGLDDEGIPGFIEDDGMEAFDPGLEVVHTDASLYNKYREAFLSDTVHVSFSNEMMEAVRMCSLNGDGLLVINGGDAIAVIDESGHLAQELLVNPMLLGISEEIDVEIAARLAAYFGLERMNYRTPGYGISQSMYASADEADIIGYFGFPIE